MIEEEESFSAVVSAHGVQVSSWDIGSEWEAEEAAVSERAHRWFSTREVLTNQTLVEVREQDSKGMVRS